MRRIWERSRWGSNRIESGGRCNGSIEEWNEEMVKIIEGRIVIKIRKWLGGVGMEYWKRIIWEGVGVEYWRGRWGWKFDLLNWNGMRVWIIDIVMEER